ncbi:hypothetical protein K443DRAFT_681436 [Laccaria amethystina LaAM-08-1]|uniref:Uncharacterized protein n=1 Tax=Laccaria amethystina LaAM-08-1 TaxID=1095629 RepID=A0A0C9XJ13_9AGAR|nr:hypothetical protein K443DRAFT_681436 [Laccaria amethystina LaAM-08-1]
MTGSDKGSQAILKCIPCDWENRDAVPAAYVIPSSSGAKNFGRKEGKGRVRREKSLLRRNLRKWVVHT